MKTAFNLFFTKKWVFYPLFVLLIIGVYTVLFYEKESIHLFLNQFYNSFFDIFFKYATYLGDGIVFPIVIVVLLLTNRKITPAFIYAGLFTLLISYILKNWVFIGFARPSEVLKGSLHLIEGVKMRHWHSFPSGHTTSAFSLFILAVLFAKKIKWQLLWLLLAIMAGLSRIYLSQHFLIDILGGAIFGTLIALISYQLFLRFPLFKK